MAKTEEELEEENREARAGAGTSGPFAVPP